MRRLEVIAKFFLALASTVFLFISGIIVPPAGVILMPLVPQPVLSFGFKYGIGGSVGILVAAILIFLVFAGPELAFIYSIFALMAGMLFSLLGRVRAIELLVVGVAAVLLSLAAGFLLYLYGSWSLLVQDLNGSLTENLAAVVRFYEEMGFPQDSLDRLKERTPQIVEMVLQVLPGLFFATLALVALINVLFLCRRFPDRRAEWLAVEDLREWQGPESLVWGLIVCGFALFVPGAETIKIFAINILLVIAACYFFHGLAIVAYLFHKNNVPRFLRGVTYVLIVFQQIFTLGVVALGLFDLWGDFRRLKKKDLNTSRAS